MTFSRAQFSASQDRKVLTGALRRADGGALRSDENYGGAPRAIDGVGGATGWKVGNMNDRSMKSNCYRAQSSGSRFLAAGLLPLPQLRCSLSGIRNVARAKHGLHQDRCNCFDAYSRAEDVPLSAVAQISQAPQKIPHSVTNGLPAGTHCARYVGKRIDMRAQACSKKSVGLTVTARTGAEYPQASLPPERNSFAGVRLPSLQVAGPLARTSYCLHPARRDFYSITPERRGNNRDVSAERCRQAASVSGTPESYSRSGPREDARTPAGGDIAFPRSLRGAA